MASESESEVTHWRGSPYRDCDRVDDHLWRFQMLDCWGSKMANVVAFAVAFII